MFRDKFDYFLHCYNSVDLMLYIIYNFLKKTLFVTTRNVFRVCKIKLKSTNSLTRREHNTATKQTKTLIGRMRIK